MIPQLINKFLEESEIGSRLALVESFCQQLSQTTAQQLSAMDSRLKSAINTIDESTRAVANMSRTVESVMTAQANINQQIPQLKNLIDQLQKGMPTIDQKVDEVKELVNDLNMKQATANTAAKQLSEEVKKLDMANAQTLDRLKSVASTATSVTDVPTGAWMTPTAIGKLYLTQNPSSEYNVKSMPNRVGRVAKALNLKRSPYFRDRPHPVDDRATIQEYSEEAQVLILAELRRTDKALQSEDSGLGEDEATELQTLQQQSIPPVPSPSPSNSQSAPNFVSGGAAQTAGSSSVNLSGYHSRLLHEIKTRQTLLMKVTDMVSELDVDYDDLIAGINLLENHGFIQVDRYGERRAQGVKIGRLTFVHDRGVTYAPKPWPSFRVSYQGSITAMLNWILAEITKRNMAGNIPNEFSTRIKDQAVKETGFSYVWCRIFLHALQVNGTIRFRETNGIAEIKLLRTSLVPQPTPKPKTVSKPSGSGV